MEHIKHTKAYRPTYTAEDNVLTASIDQVYDKFGGRRNYIDDRYPSRSRYHHWLFFADINYLLTWIFVLWRLFLPQK